jgi:hypothetical protein
MKNWIGFVLGLFFVAAVVLYIFNSVKHSGENQASAVDEDEGKSIVLPESEELERIEYRLMKLERSIDDLFDILDVNSDYRAKRIRISVLEDRKHLLIARLMDSRLWGCEANDCNEWKNQIKQIDQEIDRLTADVNN